MVNYIEVKKYNYSAIALMIMLLITDYIFLRAYTQYNLIKGITFLKGIEITFFCLVLQIPFLWLSYEGLRYYNYKKVEVKFKRGKL